MPVLQADTPERTPREKHLVERGMRDRERELAGMGRISRVALRFGSDARFSWNNGGKESALGVLNSVEIGAEAVFSGIHSATNSLLSGYRARRRIRQLGPAINDAVLKSEADPSVEPLIVAYVMGGGTTSADMVHEPPALPAQPSPALLPDQVDIVPQGRPTLSEATWQR